MKILVTGNRGFIGQNLCEDFRFTRHNVYHYEKDEQLPQIKGLDWVIHLGAISSTTASLTEVNKYNFEFSKWLYDTCKEYGVNMQYSSSAGVYGNENTTFLETDEPNPQSHYARSKYMFEEYVKENPSDDIVVQGFRYFNVFGPYEDHKGSMASPYHQFTRQAINQKEIKIFEGSDECFRDFVHVDYVVDTHWRMLQSKESGIWNIGSGHIKSFKEIAEEIAYAHAVPVKEIPFPEHLKKHYQKYTRANITKLNETLARI